MVPVLMATVLLVSLLGSSAVMASPRAHDGGLFLRLSAGGGSATSTLESGSGKAEFSGSAGDLNFAIGGIVSPNLALHGTLFGWLMSDPDLSITGLGSGQVNADVDLTAIGGGFTYFFMPSNIYLSASLGIGKLSIDAGSLVGETDNGMVMDVTLGKEWWVGDSWGLGVAGGFNYHSVPDGDIDENWSGASFVIRFSATHN